MPGDDDPDRGRSDESVPGVEPVPGLVAAERWAERSAAWPGSSTAVPPFADVADSVSTTWAREVLPPVGGTVLDIGCAAGTAALALVPPATEIIGVDPKGALLDDFVSNAAERGVARRTVHGFWPDVAATTPSADVAIAHHVVHGAADIVPFVLALTDRARLAVVIELTVEHPSPPMRSVAASLGVALAAEPIRAVELRPVLVELGLVPESATHDRTIDGDEMTRLVPAVRGWLGLTDDRDVEIEELLDRHVGGRSVEVLSLRWPGAADAPASTAGSLSGGNI